LNVIQGLRISGATRIIAVDTVAAKEALGRQFGATDFVNATDGDAAEAVRALLPPDRERASGALNPTGGVAWAFDCVGHPAVLRSALDSLDWGGNAVAIGIPPPRHRGPRRRQLPRLTSTVACSDAVMAQPAPTTTSLSSSTCTRAASYCSTSS